MRDCLEMGTGDELHRAVVHIHIIQGEPTTDQVGRCTTPVGIVLVPEDGPTMIGRFVERLIVKKLDVGAEQIFNDVEDAVVVD